MKRFKFEHVLQCAAAVAFFSTSVPVAYAGTIILEGSDAIGFHCVGGNASACAYESQTWDALSGASKTVPIAIIGSDISGTVGDVGTQAGSNTFGITLDQFASLSAAGSLSKYGAIYFLATAGCCTENDSLIPVGEDAAVLAYLAGGGTVMIENYIGGMAWNFAIDPGSPSTNLNADVAGVGGGQSSGLNCSDGETVTATGIANGFTQPAVMSCWTHQAYDQSAFTALGFTKSYFTSPSGQGYTGTGPYSSLLSNGSTLTGTAPEPASMLLIGSGLAALGIVTRRRSKNKKAA